MKLKAQLVKREIAGDTILVPVGETTTKLQGLLTINETGAAIWDALPAAENEEAIVEQLYEIDVYKRQEQEHLHHPADQYPGSHGCDPEYGDLSDGERLRLQ